MSISMTSTRNMDRKEWLEARRSGIGGSDAAALVGMNPWATPWTVWADKMGLSADKEQTEPIRLGHDLEPYVAERFTERSGLKVRRLNSMLRNPIYPFALANIDYKIVANNQGLECKTTSSWHTKEYKGGTFPDRYYAQCVHYLAVTGWDVWYLAVLVLGEGFHIYRMTRYPDSSCPEWCEGSIYVDDEEIWSLMDTEADFWNNHVETKLPPPADGDPITTTAMKSYYGSGDRDEDLLMDGAAEKAMENYIALKASEKALQREVEKSKQLLISMLAGASSGHAGRYTVSNAACVRNSFDVKSFQKAYPTLNLAPYYKTSTYTKFDVKEARR